MEKYKKYLVTAILIVANVLVFLWTDLTGGTDDTMHMVRVGAAVPELILEEREWYRLVTSMFLHFGIPVPDHLSGLRDRRECDLAPDLRPEG